jgi:hypothetical protein
MRRDFRKKIKSVSVVMFMLIAALSVITFVSVSATPGSFSIQKPASGTIYKCGTPVNISWTQPSGNTSSDTIGYNVSINGIPIAQNLSFDHNWTIWDTTNFTRCNHTINVTAWNWTDDTESYATEITVHLIRGTPGVDIWQGGSYVITRTNNVTLLAKRNILNTSTKDLKYCYNGIIKVNGSLNWTDWTTGKFYLWYPVYTGTDDHTVDYSLTWKRYTGGTGAAGLAAPSIEPSAGDFEFGTSGEERVPHLNHSGLWLIGPIDMSPNVSSHWKMNQTIPAWFWVNTSTEYNLAVDDTEFYYDDDGSVEVSVSQTGEETPPHAMVAIFAEYNGRCIWKENRAVTNGKISANKNSSVFTHTCNFTVVAYWDLDGLNESGDQIFYRDTYMAAYWRYYSNTYGSGFDPANPPTGYTYIICGPWDPPEFNASSKKLIVKPGKPTVKITNSTQYWSFAGRIDVNVTDKNGKGITGLNVVILNHTKKYPAVYTATEIGNGNYSFMENWTKGKNLTWYIVVSGNKSGNEKEEWNITISFNVKAAPGLQIMVIDDGDGNNDLKVPAGPAGLPGVRPIKFQVINKKHQYYGKDNVGGEKAARKNISISGDACLLSGKTLQELYEIGNGIVNFDGDRNWTVNLIPMMDTAANTGGEITISATWKDGGGTASPVTIKYGGTKYNGSLVSISPSEFPIGKDVTLTVTVTDPSNPDYGYMNADVRLFYINDSGALEEEIARKTAGNTKGEYTFLFNKSQQTKNQTNVAGWTYYSAPRYIAAYADIGNNEYGYAYAKLLPRHNLKVTAEVAASPGTTTMMAGKGYSTMWFNVSVVDEVGNITGYPTIDGTQNVLQFEIYNETGHNVTGLIGFSHTWNDLTVTSTAAGAANHTLTGVYITKAGTYTVYAYNRTHDSTGNNATLVVKAVNVTCDMEEFIWGVDDNVSATFTVTYNGKPVNGTLRIDNISSASPYNKTWTNTSFDGSSDQGGNASKDYEVKNGNVTVHNITANYLPEGVAKKFITFWFKPEGSVYAKANGAVPVKIADVSASPPLIPYNRPAELVLTVTGRGKGLEGVLVNITIPGLTGEMSTRTLADGTATFAFTPPTTGEIKIEIENRTSATKVKVTSWSLYIDAPTMVDEGKEFTVTVRNKTAVGAGVEGASVTFNGETKTTDANGEVTFTAPAVTITGDFKIVATKAGYAEATAIIKVLNVPKLTIIVVGKAEVAAGSKFTVIVADDAGNAVIGATVTFDEKTYTTGKDGVTLTAPSKEGTYTIEATFTGYTDADPVTITVKPAGIPGFELLTLIAALGIAFILLRRRRH